MVLIPKSAGAKKNPQPLPAIVSLFSGAGGFDLGFKQAGFRVVLAVDNAPAAVRTHQKNFIRTKSLVADLKEIGPGGVLAATKKVLRPGSKIGVIGGPPCQGFSRANTERQENDTRNELTRLYVDIVRALSKSYSLEFLVFENVLGIGDPRHSSTYRELIAGIAALDLNLTEKRLCSYDYGVPQMRRRVVLFGINSKVSEAQVVLRRRNGKKTVREAIGNLVEPAFYTRELRVAQIPLHPNHWTMQPKSPRFKETGPNRGESRSFKRLEWALPSPTIAFGHREIHIHPSGHRRLSIYEAMLIQGFPKSFVLEGSLSDQVKQISNAVPPPMARSIALAVKRALKSPRQSNV